MATREEQLQQRQEDLSKVVEPLVDSISELVLCTVTGNFENVQSTCMDIAERTNKVVLIAQQVAMSSTDVDLQMDVANAINDVAVAIEKLVTSFNAILASSNPKTQEGFAMAAKEVGDAINKLVQATDETSQHKIMNAVRDAIESAKEVQQSANYGKERLLQAAQLHVDRTVRLVKVASVAAASTADEKKKNMLTDGSNQVKGLSPQLIQAAKMVVEQPTNNVYKSELDHKANDLSEAFKIIINAAKLSPVYFGKVAETYEYIKKLIEAAQDLSAEAQNLYNVTKSGSNEQFLEAAKATANKALLLVGQAENAAKMEKDPVKRQIIKDAAQELREASQAMIKAAKAYRENPNDPTAKKNFEDAYQRLEAAIRRVQAVTGSDYNDQTPVGKLAASATALESIAKQVVWDAANSPKDLVDDAQTLAAIAMAVAKDAELVAAQTTDPAEKKRLLENAAEIKNAATRLIAAAKKVAQNPSDAQAQKELADAHKYLLDKLNQIRRDAHIIQGSSKDVEEEILVPGSEEYNLVNAAKEEAKAATEIATEAEKLAAKITDPNKKKQLLEAIKEVKLCAQRVVEAAEAVSKNPRDPNAQAKLSAAQRDLGNAIQKVVQLTTQNDAEMNNAMNEMQRETGGTGASAAETNILRSAQEVDFNEISLKTKVLDAINKAFGPNKKLTPQESIQYAKELSQKASELAQQLKDMAAKTNDPVYKEKLLFAAKVIRDGALQIKILSAVRASGGDEKSNTVGMAAKGLQVNIQEIIKEVQAEGIRNKFRSTVKQTIAINKVMKVWKTKAVK